MSGAILCLGSHNPFYLSHPILFHHLISDHFSSYKARSRTLAEERWQELPYYNRCARTYGQRVWGLQGRSCSKICISRKSRRATGQCSLVSIVCPCLGVVGGSFPSKNRIGERVSSFIDLMSCLHFESFPALKLPVVEQHQMWEAVTPTVYLRVERIAHGWNCKGCRWRLATIKYVTCSPVERSLPQHWEWRLRSPPYPNIIYLSSD